MIEINNIKDAVLKGKIIWRHHSKIRMAQRQITGKEVKEAIINGEIIENYYNEIEKLVYIISIYKPDLNQFEGDYKTRRKNNG